MYIPISIAFVLVLIGLIVSGFISSSDLELKDRITATIQTWACIAASISASFVIHSYILTNRTFVDSRRPALLLQIVEGQPRTRVHYENRSGNPFRDLTIKMSLKAGPVSIDLGDLFSSKMYMAPWDTRDRRFETRQELAKRGFDLDAAVAANTEIVLSLEYQYTFNGKVESIKTQDYVWDNVQWSIK